MHFPLNNSVELRQLVHFYDSTTWMPSIVNWWDAVNFHLTTLYVELWQLVCSYKLWKVFFHSYHVNSIGHDCQKDLDYFPKIALKYANVAELVITMSEASLFHHLGRRNKSLCNCLFVFIILQCVSSFTVFSLVQTPQVNQQFPWNLEEK